MTVASIPHGGRLSKARGDHPLAPEPWLDLSTGINPQGWRGSRAPTQVLARLPDPADVAALEAEAAGMFGTLAERVVAVAGAEAGLRLLPMCLDVRRVAIASPTYGSHGDAWRRAGVEVETVARSALFESDSELRVIVNPNNPDGALTHGRDLAARAGDRWLVIDESFIEVQPDYSAASMADDRTILLRSFGKFYGLPGVRLGFVIAPPAVAARLRGLIGDWAVGADAIVMGRAAYGDADWADRTRRRLSADAGRLDALLARTDFDVLGGVSLFRLTRCEDAAARAWRLGEQGVLVRTFDHDPGLIRFGLPGRRHWARLGRALERTR